tara:strand:- start:1052 stop:2167 length:1116 start_codon:yes stop_codon:yes gene_type:complete
MTKLNSIGIAKEPKDTLVVVAMSGGVDSSTVAAMMKTEGYKVIGVTLKLYNNNKETSQSKQCCAGQDIMDAKRVADKLMIEHKILYYQTKFKEGVIDNFIDSYLNGETPIPCIQCNQTVKFTDLFQEAKNLKADALVTGHYVKSITSQQNTEMYCGVDSNRDQSYFLFNTTKEQLNFLRFPLGNLFKDETRKIARDLDLNVADKPDSQDICFVPNGDYASVIEKFRPNSFKKGNIKDIEGKVIGVHEGIINYTIGQRKGIKISDKNPLYVIKIIADLNEIIVGGKEHLIQTKIDLKNLNIITNDRKDFEKELYVKVRSTGKLIKAKIKIQGISAVVDLFEEEQGIAPGQACVFYSKNKQGFKVLGGGWIKK